MNNLKKLDDFLQKISKFIPEELNEEYIDLRLLILAMSEPLIEFKTVTWKDLKSGDMIYCLHKDQYLTHGPFEVIDPELRYLKNNYGIKFSIPDIYFLIRVDNDS